MDWQAEMHRTASRLAENPADLQALLDRGMAASQIGDAVTSMQSLLAAWRIIGDVPSLLRNIIRACISAGDAAAAVAMARRLMALGPGTDEAEHWYLLGAALAANGELPEALQAMRRCEATPLGAQHAINYSNLTNILLTVGEWEEGLRRYEQRWNVVDIVSLERRNYLSVLPAWHPDMDGNVDLIIGGEQGSGDMLMVARYLGDIAERVRSVTVLVKTALLSLFEHSFAGIGNLRFLPYGTVDLSAFTHHLMAMSLPYMLAATPQAIPRRRGYLSAIPSQRNFRQSKTRLSIAFAWLGSAEHKENDNRSLPHDQVASFIQRAPWIDFYATSSPSMSPLAGRHPANLHFPLAESDGFEVAAALMTEMDLVLSVDSAPCHLAGALGLPVWTLLRRYPDWRWGTDPQGRSPWYASMILWRQSSPGDWAALLERVTAALAGMAKTI